MQEPGTHSWKRWKGSHVYVSAVEPGFIFRLVNDLAHWLVGYEQRVGPAIAVTVRQERSSAAAELLRLGRVEGSELATRAARPMPDPISPDVGLVLPPFPERPKWRQDNDD